MFSGWRTQLHFWSRQSGALKKTAFWIVAVSFVTAWLFAVLQGREPMELSVSPVEQGLRNGLTDLRDEASPQPRQLSRWLRGLLPNVHHLCDAAGLDYPTWESFQQDGRLANFDVGALLDRHAPEVETRQLLEDFIRTVLPPDADATAAAQRLQSAAERPSPPPLANELHAAVLIQRERPDEALPALIREAQLFTDAAYLREEALRLALQLEDRETLQLIATTEGWLPHMPAWLQFEVGRRFNDPWLIGFGMLRHRVLHLPVKHAVHALLAAALWYGILVLHSTSMRGRWLLPLLPIVAGMISTWPTLWIGAWQEITLGMRETAPFPDDLWYWVMGVGLREEVAKLMLFALFLPWLLRRRDAGLALMTGAFVGLGFAFDENIDYYERYGGAVALTRFLSANFLHVALSGLAGHALYDLFRSRFARTNRFLAVLAAVIAVHGLYDYVGSSSIDGMEYLRMALLAFTAWQFLDLMAHETPPSRQLVTPAAVFIIGMALLIGTVFWLAVSSTGSVEALYGATMQCLTLLPVGFIYWRRLQ